MTAPMADPGGPVRFERRGCAGLLTLDAPPLNVLSARVLDALVSRIHEAALVPQVRALVLASAAENAFAAGADIREMAPMGPGEALGHGSRGQAATLSIEQLPLPVIAAVHGACLGGGCEIALACDFVLASEDARFGQPEILLGVMPGWGGTQRLPRRIGATRARDWILRGRSVTAQEAFEAGFVHAVVPRGDLVSSALTLAEELGARSATALASAKRAVNHALHPEGTAGLAVELDLWHRLFGTADQREGMAAFLEKRRWTPATRELRFPKPEVPSTASAPGAGSPSRGRRSRGKAKT
ncbi:MAG TPA: enoyl-CoA hydratase-related protein [Thermoplasmata archaeon]|nr:enoyl-CoA hydratase-related protein [Thermoplasmata archaeon]